MRVGILHTAFVGDIALLGLLIEALYIAKHEIFLFSNGAAKELFGEDYRVKSCIRIEKGKSIRKFLQIRASVRAINSEKIDVLLVPHKSTTSSLISFFANAKKTVGFKTSSLSSLFDETCEWRNEAHESHKYLELAPEELVSLEIKTSLLSIGRPYLRARPELSDFTDDMKTVLKSKPYIVVAPGSVWGTKIYPPKQLAKTLSDILETYPDLNCYLTGSPKDAETIQEVLREIPDKFASSLIDVTSKVRLSALITLTANALLVITNDSAPTHIASGTNTPTLAIFGPTERTNGFWPLADLSQIATYSGEHGIKLPCQPCGTHGPMVCPLKHHKCMKDLSSSYVAKVAKAIIAKAKSI